MKGRKTMFGLKFKDGITSDWDCQCTLFLIGIFMIPLILLVVLGTSSGVTSDGETSGPYPKCLYIGLPVLFSVFYLIVGTYTLEVAKKPFIKKGLIWEKYPYICWLMKGCIESVGIGLAPVLVLPIITVKYIGIPLSVGFVKAAQTIWVVFTTPDGKAETKIKKIWNRRERPC
jgi:hypothetical protein